MRRVLVVDDEEGMRFTLCHFLRREGYVVDEACDGEDALEKLRTGQYHLALLDVRMPKMDGLTLLAKLGQLKLPVITLVMSAFVDLENAINAIKMGASDYVSKPFRPDEVLLKVRLAEERMRMSEESAQLEAENVRLRQLSQGDGGQKRSELAGVIGESQALEKIYHAIGKVADYRSTVLLLGESGTGKELAAKALHELSRRASGPFVPINCGAIPEALLESELFGHAKGAFTDAGRDKKGLVEEADTGTLFLDEIGELPISLQVKLLRFLQEDEIRRVGETQSLHLDVRVVAATSRDLPKMVEEGTFREDLFYRLNVLQLKIPPLRERREDIPLLVAHFVAKFSERLSRPGMVFSQEALRVLMEYAWPGNIRELENTVERAMVLSDGTRIEADALPEKITGQTHKPALTLLEDDLSIKKAVRRIEEALIRRGLEQTQGNRTRAAELLEISHRALLYKIKEYGLGRNKNPAAANAIKNKV